MCGEKYGESAMLKIFIRFFAFLSLAWSSFSRTSTSVSSAMSVAVRAWMSDVPLGRRFSATVLALRWVTWASSFTTSQPRGPSTGTEMCLVRSFA
jgi:hypothetical protein